MDLNVLKPLYQCIKRECEAIELFISNEEKTRNKKVREKMKRLKSSLCAISILIEAAEKRVLNHDLKN